MKRNILFRPGHKLSPYIETPKNRLKSKESEEKDSPETPKLVREMVQFALETPASNTDADADNKEAYFFVPPAEQLEKRLELRNAVKEHCFLLKEEVGTRVSIVREVGYLKKEMEEFSVKEFLKALKKITTDASSIINFAESLIKSAEYLLSERQGSSSNDKMEDIIHELEELTNELRRLNQRKNNALTKIKTTWVEWKKEHVNPSVVSSAPTSHSATSCLLGKRGLFPSRDRSPFRDDPEFPDSTNNLPTQSASEREEIADKISELIAKVNNLEDALLNVSDEKIKNLESKLTTFKGELIQLRSKVLKGSENTGKCQVNLQKLEKEYNEYRNRYSNICGYSMGPEQIADDSKNGDGGSLMRPGNCC